MLAKKLYFKLIRIIEQDLDLHLFADKEFIQAVYYSTFGKVIDWKKPVTFNEKIQWLKLNDRNPQYQKLVDKYEAKQIIGKKIGKRYIIPSYGVWDKYEDINFDKLPDTFVLKCTHDSGGIYVCKDKAKALQSDCKQIISNSLNRNFYYVGREWPYKNVHPRVLAEALISDNANEGGLTDYKIHCFNGEPKLILICQNRFSKTGIQETFVDTKWKILDIKRPNIEQCSPFPEKPKCLEEMLYIARKLSEGIPFVRIDLYKSENQLYFGEMTFYPASGFIPFEPMEYDEIMGEWLDLNGVSK